jgi:hypothetical protein
MITPIKVVTENKEPVKRSEMSLRVEPHLCFGLAALYIAQSTTSQCIKTNNFKGSMNLFHKVRNNFNDSCYLNFFSHSPNEISHNLLYNSNNSAHVVQTGTVTPRTWTDWPTCETLLRLTVLHSLHTAPCLITLSHPAHAVRLHYKGCNLLCFSLLVRTATLPGVPTVVTHVVTTLLLTATQAWSLLVRSGLPTNTLLPVVHGRSNH